MKKALFLALTVCSVLFSLAASTPSPEPKLPIRASEFYVPIGNTGKVISLLDLSRISVKEVEQLSGKKMKLADRIGFRIAQHKLRSNINADGTFNNKKIQKQMKKTADITSGFHIGGFALGFFLSIIGLLIAYLINDDKKAARVKWAWIGFAVSLLIYLIVIVA